jgi:sugar transferase (PEP-CTERM/EpsH1 system associated)
MEKLLVEFARHCDRSAFELIFISLQSRGDLAREIESCGWQIIALEKREGLQPSVVLRLANQLRTIRPHVVHTHNTAAYFYGVAAAKFVHVPRVIHTRHGQRINASSRQTLVFSQMSRWVEHIVSVSSDGSQMTKQEGICDQKLKTIHNGVDLHRYVPRAQRAPGRALVVARLSPEKDIATLLQAMKHVTEIHDSTSNRLMLDVVGDGSERESLQQLSQKLGICDRVFFHGMQDDIASRMHDASLFVLPSTSEGISLTILEAMASGLPVVACRVGGNPEVVVDGETGILVPARDPKSLAEALIRLHGDVHLSQMMGTAGRRRVERDFCVRRMVRAYESLYRGEHPLQHEAA